MFGVGLGEFILIIIVVLIFISPDKLPEVAKAFAKTYREIKRAGTEIRRSVAEVEAKPGEIIKDVLEGGEAQTRDPEAGHRPGDAAKDAHPPEKG